MKISLNLIGISVCLLLAAACKKGEEDNTVTQSCASAPFTITNESLMGDSLKLYNPTAFTPDGDGLNDRFLVIGEKLEVRNLRILRNGNLVWESDELNPQWDGLGTDSTKASSGEFDFDGFAVTIVPDPSSQDTFPFSGKASLLSGDVVITNCSSCTFPDQYKEGEGLTRPTSEGIKCQ